MYEDKIVKGGEITTQGEYNASNETMYLFIAPKTDEASAVAIFSVKLSQGEDYTDYPFVCGLWNPVVVNKINVKAEDLANYRIFWGESL